MSIEVEHAIPILPSRDLQETLEFYARLGFENRGGPHEEWGYLIIGRGGVEQQTGMPRAAERAVEIAATGMRLERGQRLVRHHRHMYR